MDAGVSPLRTATRVLVVFASLLVFVASLTVLFLAGRAVMDIGGSCASGGPYVVGRTCPKGTAWMAPVSIFVGLGAVLLYAVACLRLPGPRLVLLAWPALFLSLGWSFWEYGLDPPEGASGVAVGWIVCGVVFVLMGGAPLLLFVTSAKARHDLVWGDAVDLVVTPSRRDTVREGAKQLVPAVYRSSDERRRAATRSAPPAVEDDVVDGDDEVGGDAGLVDELERLAHLHRRGDLTPDEYAAAKARVIEGGSS